MKIKTLTLILVLMVMGGISFFLIQGCGKKGPPVLPIEKGKKMTAPYDLKYAVNEKDIELTWNHKVDEKEAFVKPENFEVFVAKLTFDSCQGCPFEFKKIGLVMMPYMRFVTGVEKGYKYYFRVRAKGIDNLASEYSETVLFEYR